MAETITENAVVIGAHPDDELLWFTAVLRKARTVIIVYRDYWADPSLGLKRTAAVADHPHPDVRFPALPEPGSFGMASRTAPEPDRFGLAFDVRTVALREAKRRAMIAARRRGSVAPAPVRRLYEQSFVDVKAALAPLLDGTMNVFTHNPWGEYGHEDHVLVHRAVCDLRRQIGFTQWMPHYVTPRSMALAERYLAADPAPPVTLPADIAYARKVADLYRRHRCWTWRDDWSWFAAEHFSQVTDRTAPADGPGRHLGAMNLFAFD